MSKPTSIDAYIAGFPELVQERLEQIRGSIHRVVPGLEETIKYDIPTFMLNGRNLVHFAAYKKHIGFYPVPSGIEAFEAELSTYKQGKGSVHFPLDQPLPLELINRIARYYAEKNQV